MKDAGLGKKVVQELFDLIPSHFLLDFLKLRSHAVTAGLSLQSEAPAARSAAETPWKGW
jgi:hypothetical protein